MCLLYQHILQPCSCPSRVLALSRASSFSYVSSSSTSSCCCLGSIDTHSMKNLKWSWPFEFNYMVNEGPKPDTIPNITAAHLWYASAFILIWSIVGTAAAIEGRLLHSIQE